MSRVVSRSSWPLRASSSEASIADRRSAAGACGECLRSQPFQPRAPGVACKLLFGEVPARVVIGRQQLDVGEMPPNLDRTVRVLAHALPAWCPGNSPADQ
jgi:hypothetical protein